MNTSRIYDISKCISGEYDDAIYQRLKILIPKLEERVGMDFDPYSNVEIASFMELLISILDSDEAIIGNKEKKKEQYNPNKKMIDSICNGDLDLPLMDLVKNMMKEAYMKWSFANESFVPNFFISDQEYVERKVEYTHELRQRIRFANKKYDALVDCMKLVFKDIVDSVNISRKSKREGTMYNPIETLYFIKFSLGAFCDVFMQALIYGIIDNATIDDAEKNRRLTNIESQIMNVINLYNNTKEVKHINLQWDMAMCVFVIDIRNELRTYQEVFAALDMQMSTEGYVFDIPEQYQCKKRYLSDFTSENEYRPIILERELEEKEKNKPGRFKEDIIKCQELCEDLFLVTNRQLWREYLQHIKVVYREVLQDIIQFNGKQTRTILNNLLKKDVPYFDSVKESCFLREKISRGLMREKGYAKYYVVKNRIQNMIYDHTIRILEDKTFDEIAIAQCLKLEYAKLKRILISEMEGL